MSGLVVAVVVDVEAVVVVERLLLNILFQLYFGQN